VCPRHYAGGYEENHEALQTGYSMSGPRLENKIATAMIAYRIGSA
jgi:hypothetical protein